MAASAWHLLGIAPTDDPSAIRRAYAAALKAIDVDVEPRRFVALREAYEAVRSGLRELSLAERTDAGVGSAAAAVQPEPGQADRTAVETIAARLLDLLRDDRPTDAIEAELADLTLRMLAEVERDTIDRQVDAEEWMVRTILAYRPRGDAMVRPAVASFRWQDRHHGQWRPDRAILVLDRMRELSFADHHVLREGGRHHLAWRALQHPPRRDLLDRPDFPTLAAVQAFFEEAGGFPKVANVSFDPDIVLLWHERLRRSHLALSRWRRRRKPGWRGGIERIGQALALVALWSLVGVFLLLMLMPL